MRTFERGVERETLACGTGAMAVAWVLHHLGDRPSSVALRAASGEILKVAFPKSLFPTETILEGGASLVYQGRIHQEELAGLKE
jgi:diaminopimelate epimerase